MTTRIDLTHCYRLDWKELISHHTADQERTRKMIQRFEADIPDIVVPPIPKYVSPPKEKVNPLKILLSFRP